jgi:hypothetical protein
MSRNEAIEALLKERRHRLQAETGRPLRTPEGQPGVPLTEAQRAYLQGEALDLYWNDLEWENVTEEERMEGGPLPELTFPGFLAFVRGLLLTRVKADSLAEASPRPEVVEDLLTFLAGRLVDLSLEVGGADAEEGDRAALEYRMTDGLLDRVLMTYHGIQAEDAGTLDGD